MNGLDLVFILFTLLAIVGGWRLGLLRRLSSWIGAAVGLGIAIAVLPDVVERLQVSSDMAVFAIGAALLVLLATLGQALGALIGSRLRRSVDGPVVQRADQAGGAVLGIVGVLVLVWLVVPVMSETAGWPPASARGSVIARLVDEHFPAPPSQVAELERQLAGGSFPQIFAGLRQAPELPPPPEGSTISSSGLSTAARSIVRIEAAACQFVQSGSGFFIEEGLVATNAHVVAGADVLELTTADGERGEGRAVSFDPSVDLALVRTTMDRPALPLATAADGDQGLVLGFPGGGELAPSPFEIGDSMRATGYDIYDRSLVTRELLVLSSSLEPGDSGSAVLRDDLSVIGIAVAVAPDKAGVAYALSTSELSDLLSSATPEPASTGDCLR